MVHDPQTSHERFLRAVHKTVHLVDRHADRVLSDAMGGRFSQFLILMAIAHCQGLSQQKIAAFLDLTPAAISRQIDALVASGHIKREQDPNSRRSHVVSLTKSGQEKFAAMHRYLLAWFEGQAGVSAEELDMATAVMEKVLKAMGHEAHEHKKHSH